MAATNSTSPSHPVVDAAIVKIGEIATLPEVTVKITRVVEDPKATARDLHEVIKNDPALSAKILKVVNSAFYGLPGQISSVDRAIVLLGLSAIKNISIAMSMTRMFQGHRGGEGLDGREIWRHSVAVAVACRLIGKLQGHPPVEECFLAGLLHDLGLLVERQAFGPKMREVIQRYSAAPKPFVQVETEILGADHQLFGHALATRWRFPRTIKIAIGYHHRPMDVTPEAREIAAVVHVADILACQADIGFSCTARDTPLHDTMLELIGVSREGLAQISEELPAEVSLAESLLSD